jgi:hypothetical protein
MLLFVPNVVLSTCYYTSILNAFNCLCHRDTRKDWIGAEAWDKFRTSSYQFAGELHKPSQLRPPSGTRPIGPATGPNCTSTPFPACSEPMALPRLFMSRVLHVAATFIPAGKAEFSSAGQIISFHQIVKLTELN